MGKQAVDLAAFDRDDDFVEARIAGDGLDRPVFVLCKNARNDRIFRTRIERADHEFLPGGLEVRERSDARAPRDPERIGRTAGAAHIGKLCDVIVDALLRHHVAQEEPAAPRHAERKPVRCRNVIEMIGENDATRALHVARHNDRIARNIFCEIARQHTHFAVDAAAGRKARNDRERLAGVEILRRADAARRQQRKDTQCNDAGSHVIPIIRNDTDSYPEAGSVCSLSPLGRGLG